MKRYDMGFEIDYPIPLNATVEPIESDTGEWCKWEDVEALQAENAKLKELLATERMSADKTLEHNNRLINEITDLNYSLEVVAEEKVYYRTENIKLREALDVKEKVAQYLYQLLDDIDTAGDMAKSNDIAYRKMVEALQKQKGRVVAECDGYTVTFQSPEPHLNKGMYNGLRLTSSSSGRADG